jgi:hypothetical protein
VLKDSSTIIGEGKRALPFRPRSKNENVILDALSRRKNDSATRIGLFSLIDRSDTTDLDGTIVVDQKVVIRDENVILEFSLGGSCHADGGRKVDRKCAGSHKGEGRCVGVDFGGEDPSNGGAGCTPTDYDDALAVILGHCEKKKVKSNKVRGEVRMLSTHLRTCC